MCSFLTAIAIRGCAPVKQIIWVLLELCYEGLMQATMLLLRYSARTDVIELQILSTIRVALYFEDIDIANRLDW